MKIVIEDSKRYNIAELPLSLMFFGLCHPLQEVCRCRNDTPLTTALIPGDFCLDSDLSPPPAVKKHTDVKKTCIVTSE
ncbi:hypothetical protein E2C01_087006 [Portunus trituberculatus]|uniref:Uncharacterized protein n=1 Tax=Portunus trituberculatus TaxID=210409 RepID=A0A5B7J5D1_PORTR|nr:hypothetical protein [Portunus trituberculatus]